MLFSRHAAEVIRRGRQPTVDTNSAWIGEVFAAHGIALHRITSISDNAEEIVAALDEARARVDLILITGGLGPTRDDITKHTLADYFGMELEMNEDVLQGISAWFHGRGLPMLPVNEAQAMLPDGCRSAQLGVQRWACVRGIAGRRSQVVVSMPGVPTK